MSTTQLNRKNQGHDSFVGVTLKRYCEITGETAPAVRSRIQRGDWAEGLHYYRDPHNHIWIIPQGVNQWLKSGSKTA